MTLGRLAKAPALRATAWLVLGALLLGLAMWWEPSAGGVLLGMPPIAIRFTDEVRQQVLAMVRGGASREIAAMSAGIDRRTLYRWLTRGQADREAGQQTDYTAFLGDFERAEARAMGLLEGSVLKAASRDWRASAWLLARKSPELFGDKESAQRVAAQAIEVFLERIHERCSKETYEDVLANAFGSIEIKELKS